MLHSQVSVQTGRSPCCTLIRPSFRMFLCFIFALGPALPSINTSFTLAQSPLNVAACHPPLSAMRSLSHTQIQFNVFFFISDTALPCHPHHVGLSPACSHSPSLPLTPLPPVLSSCVKLSYKSLLAYHHQRQVIMTHVACSSPCVLSSSPGRFDNKSTKFAINHLAHLPCSLVLSSVWP